MSESESIAQVRASEIDTTTMPTLDVRSKPGKQQIRGALRYDRKALLGEERLALPFPHNGRIVVYGDNDEDARTVAARLRQQGYTNAAVLEGGFDAYRNAGLPVEEITQDQPVPGDDDAGIPRL